eukprot:1030397-Pelagomonas_calceolata.AAC.1
MQKQRHVHFIVIKYCEDTRCGQQLEGAQRQHAGLCKNVNGKAVTLHTNHLGVGRGRYNEHTINYSKDYQRASKLAHKLHAHSVKYALKLITTRCVIKSKGTPHSQVLTATVRAHQPPTTQHQHHSPPAAGMAAGTAAPGQNSRGAVRKGQAAAQTKTAELKRARYPRQLKQHGALPGDMGLLEDKCLGLQIMGMGLRFSEFHLRVI